MPYYVKIRWTKARLLHSEAESARTIYQDGLERNTYVITIELTLSGPYTSGGVRIAHLDRWTGEELFALYYNTYIEIELVYWLVQCKCYTCRATFKDILVYFSKVVLCELHPVCLCNPHHYQLLNSWASLYETWYGTWTHLNGILQSVCLYVYPSYSCKTSAW
jgi:hypothetical protein